MRVMLLDGSQMFVPRKVRSAAMFNLRSAAATML